MMVSLSSWQVEHMSVCGIPLKRLIEHPAIRLGMRSVILGEGGNPDDWEALRISPRTRLGLVEVELGSLAEELGYGATGMLVREARGTVTEALAIMKRSEPNEVGDRPDRGRR